MTDKCTFKVGDVVRLKSGGPKLIVEKLGEFSTDRLWVAWFYHGKKEGAMFDPNCLKKESR